MAAPASTQPRDAVSSARPRDGKALCTDGRTDGCRDVRRVACGSDDVDRVEHRGGVGLVAVDGCQASPGAAGRAPDDEVVGRRLTVAAASGAAPSVTSTRPSSPPGRDRPRAAAGPVEHEDERTVDDGRERVARTSTAGPRASTRWSGASRVLVARRLGRGRSDRAAAGCRCGGGSTRRTGTCTASIAIGCVPRSPIGSIVSASGGSCSHRAEVGDLPAVRLVLGEHVVDGPRRAARRRALPSRPRCRRSCRA